jgi:hypothetical protein
LTGLKAVLLPPPESVDDDVALAQPARAVTAQRDRTAAAFRAVLRLAPLFRNPGDLMVGPFCSHVRVKWLRYRWLWEAAD